MNNYYTNKKNSLLTKQLFLALLFIILLVILTNIIILLLPEYGITLSSNPASSSSSSAITVQLSSLSSSTSQQPSTTILFPSTKPYIVQYLYHKNKPLLSKFNPILPVLEQRGFEKLDIEFDSIPKHNVTDDVFLWLTNNEIPNTGILKGKQMINAIGKSVSECIGGPKSSQLFCREQFTQAFGCSYQQLQISPPEISLLNVKQCREFFFSNPSLIPPPYIIKPIGSHNGRGIHITENFQDLLKEFNPPCPVTITSSLSSSSSKPFVISKYINNPVTIRNGYKYDIRTYLLVATCYPNILAFYHDGFGHKADTKFTRGSFNETNQHITNADTQNKHENFVPLSEIITSLEIEMKFPKDFYRKVIRKRAIEISKFTLQAALFNKTIQEKNNPGRFHLFAFDMIIEAGSGHLWLLEGNTGPGYAWYKYNPKLIPGGDFYGTMFDLVFHLQTNHQLEELKKNSILRTYDNNNNIPSFKYKGWELIYNEKEERGKVYNPCKQLLLQ
jgi:hypothetical protein